MDGWIDELAGSLGVDELDPHEESTLLAAARDVAHGVERRITPLTTFIVGIAVERRVAAGSDRPSALAEVLAIVEDRVPDPGPDEVP